MAQDLDRPFEVPQLVYPSPASPISWDLGAFLVELNLASRVLVV